MICTGNVCRSPVVETLLQKRLIERGVADCTVHSAGTKVTHSHPASRFSVEVIYETESIDLKDHRSKIVTQAMVQQANLVLCMEAKHKQFLRLVNPAENGKIFLLSEMVSNSTGKDVPDPYGEDKLAYQKMVETVTNLVDQGFERIIQLARN